MSPSRKTRKPFEDLPQNMGVMLSVVPDYLLVEWLPAMFGQSVEWVESNLLYPCNPRTGERKRDGDGNVKTGVPVIQLGYKKIIRRQALDDWLSRQEAPLMRSTWGNGHGQEAEVEG